MMNIEEESVRREMAFNIEIYFGLQSWTPSVPSTTLEMALSYFKLVGVSWRTPIVRRIIVGSGLSKRSLEMYTVYCIPYDRSQPNGKCDEEE